MADMAHRSGEIVGGDKKNVDMIDGEDFVEITDGDNILDQRH